jgi:4,5:9,10-diseco-3-hydroxy-5,9,17-trioxoandrosta-1(10),2-diene-4-oate hydrolase
LSTGQKISDGVVQALPMTSQATNCSIEQRWLVLEGARMRYLFAGSGPSLVLVHGLLGYSFSWRFTMPALAEYASLYAVDMLGWGFSEKPESIGYDIQSNAKRLIQFVKQLGIERCTLVGASHGGAVAVLAAALDPDRIERLILVAPANPWSSQGQWRARVLSNRIVAPMLIQFAPHLAFTHGFFLRRLFGDTTRIRPGTLEGYSAPYLHRGALTPKAALLRSWKRDLGELESALKQIKDTPTLLIWGSLDRAVDPASGARLREFLCRCREVILEGVGHVPYEEVPEEFNRIVIDFLQRA